MRLKDYFFQLISNIFFFETKLQLLITKQTTQHFHINLSNLQPQPKFILHASDNNISQCNGFVSDGYGRSHIIPCVLIINTDNPYEFSCLSGVGEAFMDNTPLLIISHGNNKNVLNAISCLSHYTTSDLQSAWTYAQNNVVHYPTQHFEYFSTL